MQETINGYIVTFTIDTNNQVTSIEIPIAGGGDASQKITFAYGVPLVTARAIATSLINNL